MGPYPGITSQSCADAFRIACRSLSEAADMKVANKYAGTLVVVNPFAVPSSFDPSKVGLEEVRQSALFERRVREDYEDAAKYDVIALTKVRDLWVLRHLLGPNFTGRDIQQNFPHMYRSGMTKWHGGICRAGVPMAFSGVQGNFDEAFTMTVAVWLEAGAREEMTRIGGVMAGQSSYIM